MKADTAAVLERNRPNLWWTESKLGEAIARLEFEDPEEAMTEDEASLFIAEFVSPAAVEARRDEFARFLLAGDAAVVSKRAEAAALSGPILEQAERLARGLEKMRQQAIRLMQASGVAKLAGATYLLKLKDSPGSVEVVDEAEIPPEFWRTKSDADFVRIERLATIVQLFAPETPTEDERALLDECATLLAHAKAERRAVDKKLIQQEWKAFGDTFTVIDPETGEATEAPMVPGTRKSVTTKLLVE